MHGSKRTATVTCKNSVELLAVGRDDFVDIFMPKNKDQEPEHIRFLRSVNILNGWPIECLPHHDPKICCFTFFRYVYIFFTLSFSVVKLDCLLKGSKIALIVNINQEKNLY